MIYYRPIQSVPPAAGWVFELRTHQVFTKEQTIQVFPLHGCRAKVNLVYDNYTSSKERQNPMNLRLTGSTEYPLVEAGPPETNRYYRPESNGFPGIDSLFLIHLPNEPFPILLTLQITWNRRGRGVDEKGLRKIDDLQLSPYTRRYWVVVTPKDIHPKITVPVKHPQDGE
jgi:hypothetical protein